LSKFVSIGNKADITENDLLLAFKDDPHTDVILMYIEDLADPKGFIELAHEITSNVTHNKPILAIKSGRTVEGAKAALSHTGALGSSDEAYDSLFDQSGVIRVETIEELFNYAMAFSSQPLPRGNRIGIVTNAGGFGIMATDVAVRNGLKLARFEKTTKDRLKRSLYESANINNPVDIIGDAKKEQYTEALDSILTDKNVDGAILISTPPPMISLKDIITSVSNVITEHSKPVMACCMGVTDISDSLNILDEKKIPHYQFPEAAARSLATLSNYAQWLNRIRTEVVKFNISPVKRKKVKDLIGRAKKEDRNFLPEPEAHEILRSYGFPTLKSGLVQTEKECCSLAENIGYPVALKIVSPDIVHKIDVGGVIINIRNKEELIKGYNRILKAVKTKRPEADLWGIFVQQMAEMGKETIIGMNRDTHFGAMLMFGLGGVYVEALKDVTFRIAPIRELSAYDMIHNIRGYKLLAGVRGEKPSDINTIAECLQRLSQLVTDFKDIVELDINPFIVNEEGKGGKVVDARILINV
jgi:acetyltransferase